MTDSKDDELDSLELASRRAEQQGYGVHYGAYMAAIREKQKEKEQEIRPPKGRRKKDKQSDSV